MQDKIVYVHFNRLIYLNNQQVIWDLMYKEVSPSYMIYMVATAVVLTTGLILDLRGGLPLTTVVGIGMLISILWRFKHVRTVRRNFFARADMMADKYENELGDYTYEFTDAGITYRDRQTNTTEAWELFEPFKVHDDFFLLLYLKAKEPVHYIISKQEIGDQMFTEVYAIFLEKLGLDYKK